MWSGIAIAKHIFNTVSSITMALLSAIRFHLLHNTTLEIDHRHAYDGSNQMHTHITKPEIGWMGWSSDQSLLFRAHTETRDLIKLPHHSKIIPTFLNCWLSVIDIRAHFIFLLFRFASTYTSINSHRCNVLKFQMEKNPNLLLLLLLKAFIFQFSCRRFGRWHDSNMRPIWCIIWFNSIYFEQRHWILLSSPSSVFMFFYRLNAQLPRSLHTALGSTVPCHPTIKPSDIFPHCVCVVSIVLAPFLILCCDWISMYLRACVQHCVCLLPLIRYDHPR